MPELPDVELFKRYLDRTCRGRVIKGATLKDTRLLGAVSAARLSLSLKGARISGSCRHGKYLFVDLGKTGWLLLHFGMNGSLTHYVAAEDEPAYDRLRIDFADGHHLAYVNPRRIGRIDLVGDLDDFIRAESLGPDALAASFRLKNFRQALAGFRRDIKSVLMDQTVLSGVGNIYSDEILFQARLHPKSRSNALDAAAAERLFRATKSVLGAAIKSGAGSEHGVERLPAGFLLPQRHRGGHCPRCGEGLATVRQGARTGYYCPRCQPAPS